MAKLTLLLGLALTGQLATAQPASSHLIHDYDAYHNGTYGLFPNQSYVSFDLTSPLFQVNTWNTHLIDQSKRFVLFDTLQPNQVSASYIFSTKDLSLVYATSPARRTGNTRVQELHGEKYFTHWASNDTTSISTGKGYCYFRDSTYTLKYTVTPQGLPSGVLTDLHECEATADGTVIISIYMPVPHDLSAVGGKVNGTLIDSGFQEIDITTGKAIFTWWARDHYNITDSVLYPTPQAINNGWDWFHLNSVEKTRDGYLVSARLLDLITHVSKADGKPVWNLGGKLNQFRDLSNGSATAFGFQHHARALDADLTKLTLFDNHGYAISVGCKANCSRALHLSLDHDAKTVRLTQQDYHPVSLAAAAEGSVQVQKNGNSLMQWGNLPAITEMTQNGKVAWDIQYSTWTGSLVSGSYRAFKQDWVGYPTWDPSIATKDHKVYVSWNGATEVQTWAVYTDIKDGSTHGCRHRFSKKGSRGQNLCLSHHVSKRGFETSFEAGHAKQIGVEALDRHHRVLGSTKVLQL